MHPLIQTILLTVLVPATVAGCFALAASWLPPGRWRSGMVAAGLAAGWCAGSWLAVRVPRWPAMQAADWQFYAVAAAGVLALVGPIRNAARAWRWLAGFFFFAVFFALLLQRVLVGLWPGPGVLAWPLGLAAVSLLNAGAVERVGRSVQAAWTFFILVVFAVPLSALLTLSGAASIGHGVGLLASACGGSWLVAWGLRRQVDFGPVGFVVAVVLGGLIGQGVFFGGLGASSAGLAALAWPAATGSVWLVRQGSGKIRAGFATAVVAAFGGVALWLAAR